MDAAWAGSGVRSLSGTTTGAEMDGVSRVPQLPGRLLLFAFLSLWFFLCVIKNGRPRSVGRGSSVHLLPPVPLLLGGQRHLEPAGSIAAGWS